MMVAQGSLLVIVAITHLVMTQEVGRIVSIHTTAEAFVFLWPPYELDHIVVGAFLAAQGLLAIVCAGGIRAGERRVWWIALINALAILAILPAIGLTVGFRYFADAPAFLAAAAILAVLGLWMLIPLLWIRNDFFGARTPPR
jgi:hypothetical protein